MAENYTVGNHRLWYKSKGFVVGVNVTIDFRSPTLQKWEDLVFTEMGDGLYYLDFTFDEYGDWIAVVYENGMKVSCQSYFISNDRGGGGFIGGNVINGN